MSRSLYEAFGEKIICPGNDTNPFGYCGEYTDGESYLIYLRNRYYDPENGAFLSEDPIYDGTNWYTYCENDPVNHVDPWGLDSYIIYDTTGISGDNKHTFYDEALIRKEQLESTWGTKAHILGVSNAWAFTYVWNNTVGYDASGNEIPIEEVVIIAHGSIEGRKADDTAQGYFCFSSGDTKSKVYAKFNVGESQRDYSVADLSKKTMQYLNFSTCNSGNPDVYNLAYAFKIKMNIQQYIIAWDGGTIFNYETKQLEAGARGKGIQEVFWQYTWYRYTDKDIDGMPRRQRIGYRQISGT